MTMLVTNLVNQLKSRQLSDYTMPELQQATKDIYGVFKRVKQKEDREVLNTIWNKVAERYNYLIKLEHPRLGDVYIIDYLKSQTNESSY